MPHLPLLIAAMLAAFAVVPVGAQTPADDSGRYQITVIGDQDADVIRQWMQSDDQLREFAGTSHVTEYSATNVLYRERLASQIPANQTPAIVLADPTGGVIYYASRDTLPTSAEQLRREFITAIERYTTAEQSIQATTEAGRLRDRIRRPLRDTVLKDPSVRGIGGRLLARWWAGSELKQFTADLALNTALAVILGCVIGYLFIPEKPLS